jgi:hypothetical protein
LIENRQTETLQKYYLKRTGLFLSRYSKIFKENVKSAQIKHVKEGSVEIIIDNIPLIAKILIPFVVLGVQRKLARHDQRVTFNVFVEDPEIQNYMDMFKNSRKNEEDLQSFINFLSNSGYNVTALSERVYDVEKITERYAKRIARTIKMNY